MRKTDTHNNTNINSLQFSISEILFYQDVNAKDNNDANSYVYAGLSISTIEIGWRIYVYSKINVITINPTPVSNLYIMLYYNLYFINYVIIIIIIIMIL
jgi:hypothetical protein